MSPQRRDTPVCDEDRLPGRRGLFGRSFKRFRLAQIRSTLESWAMSSSRDRPDASDRTDRDLGPGGAGFGLSSSVGMFHSQSSVGHADRNILVDAVAIVLAIVIPTIIGTLGIAWVYRASNLKATYLPDWTNPIRASWSSASCQCTPSSSSVASPESVRIGANSSCRSHSTRFSCRAPSTATDRASIRISTPAPSANSALRGTFLNVDLLSMGI